MYAINLEQLSSLIIMSQIYFWMNLDQPHQRKRQKFDQLQNRPKLSKKFNFRFPIFFSNFATITLQTLLIWQAIFCNHFMVLTKSYVLGQLKVKQLAFDLNYYGFAPTVNTVVFSRNFLPTKISTENKCT